MEIRHLVPLSPWGLRKVKNCAIKIPAAAEVSYTMPCRSHSQFVAFAASCTQSLSRWRHFSPKGLRFQSWVESLLNLAAWHTWSWRYFGVKWKCTGVCCRWSAEMAAGLFLMHYSFHWCSQSVRCWPCEFLFRPSLWQPAPGLTPFFFGGVLCFPAWSFAPAAEQLVSISAPTRGSEVSEGEREEGGRYLLWLYTGNHVTLWPRTPTTFTHYRP